MTNVLFTPRAYQNKVEDVAMETPAPLVKGSDKIGSVLLKAMRVSVVALAFLIPIFFVPKLYASLGFDKAVLTVVLGLAVVVFASLAVLRFSRVSTVVPLPLILFLAVTVAAFLSAFLSGDVMDSIRGSLLETQTAGFMAVMFLAMTIPLALQRSKTMSLGALIAFASAASLIVLYNLVRLVFGAEFLSLSSFDSLTVSPIGGFNDLAIFSAITVVLGLVTLLQLPLKPWMQWFLASLISLSVLFLMIVNFFFLWLIIGFFGLLFLIYILTKDTLFKRPEVSEEAGNGVSPVIVFMTLLVCVLSALFVVAGDFAGNKISQITEINYIEVRPSMSATIDMVKAEYRSDAFLGTGPNRFSDLWRVNKDPSINETAFWNVDFVTGFGFVPTLFATLGLLGGVLFLAFNVSYLYLGYRMLLRNESTDPFWYYVGTASFTSSLILWVVSYVYSPGAAILIITAFFTGLSFVAYQSLVPSAAKTIPLASSRKQGFFLMAISVVLVVGSVATLFSVGKQYIAQTDFVKSISTATSVEEFELAVQSAYGLYPDDRFITTLARAKLASLRQLLSKPEPNEADQQAFVSTAQQVILLAQEAARTDTSNPDAYSVLADVYFALAQAGLEGAMEQANSALEEAKKRDPLDPTYSLFSAYVAAQTGDLAKAREQVNNALGLKRNFGEALFLLSQIDIQEGNVEAAIATTQQLVTFEPENPTRFYQLGILLAANKQYNEAVAAYQEAIAKDANFANARYMMALTMLELKNNEGALEQLRTVQQTNQDNAELAELIRQIESGQYTSSPNLGLESPVEEGDPNQTTEDGVVTSSDTDTDLVSPVNTPAAEGQTNQPENSNDTATPAANTTTPTEAGPQ
jgi:tetratricopeptide (TPR) repeat protein